MQNIKNICVPLVFCFTVILWSQEVGYEYAVSESLPYGMINPKAPEQLSEYAELIGTCDCESVVKKLDGTWAEPIDMQWTFKYIMNGMAVQDETLKSDGTHSGSIRQFSQDSLKWYVHYFTTRRVTPKLNSWEGGRKGNEIILYTPQKAPNGMDGFYKIRFYDISEEGFNWIGAWTTKEEDFFHENWKIFCRKRKST